VATIRSIVENHADRNNPQTFPHLLLFAFDFQLSTLDLFFFLSESTISCADAAIVNPLDSALANVYENKRF
jgi:hypothetical protein